MKTLNYYFRKTAVTWIVLLLMAVMCLVVFELYRVRQEYLKPKTKDCICSPCTCKECKCELPSKRKKEVMPNDGKQ